MAGFTTCLWFDGNALDAAQFYVSIFPNSTITSPVPYREPDAAMGQGRFQQGNVMSVSFQLNGQKFLALNGGPMLQFSAATSFMVWCKDQEEVDYYWAKLREGGDESKQHCGWLQDKFGVTWQVVPEALGEMRQSGEKEKVDEMLKVMLKMKKFDIATLREAFEGGRKEGEEK